MKILVLLFFSIPVISLGQQIVVDFEENDLTGWYSPCLNHWCISEDNALDGSYSLKHCFNDSIAGQDVISFFHQPVPLECDTAVWQFELRYGFTPSRNNHWAVIISDNSLPDNDGRCLNGLVLGVNYEGNSDELKVWSQYNGITEEIFNTGFNWQEEIDPGTIVTLRLFRSHDDRYSILIEKPDQSFVSVGDFSHRDLNSANIFMLCYRYTATCDQGLWLDNLIIRGTFRQDTIAPFVRVLYVKSPTALELSFSEPVCVNSASDWCVDGNGCTSLNGIYSVVSLELPNPLHPGNVYHLNVPLLEDLYGNDISEDNRQMEFYYPGPYDLLITEIMADPNPGVFLPETEYVELYNSSGSQYSIKDWRLTVNSKTLVLPPMDIPAGAYLILCDNFSDSSFDSTIRLYTAEDFPALSNSGAQLILLDASGRLVHSVNYQDTWHTEPEKKEGGWSLEMINTLNPCHEKENWASSVDYRGGTPGILNSLSTMKKFNSHPDLWRVAVTERGSLMLYFSQALDSSTLAPTGYYMVDHGIGHPEQILVSWPLADHAELFFLESFAAGREYEISLTDDICNCSGTKLDKNTLQFRVSSIPVRDGILISEVLSDPEPGRREFIEIVNRSGNVIDLRDYRLNIDDPSVTANIITNEYWPLAAGEYAIITGGYDGIDSEYNFDSPEKIICMPGMPRLPNDGATVYLLDQAGEIADRIIYSPEWHHEILREVKGVSLERISMTRPGVDPHNWHSAASDADYMTPAAPNSVGDDWKGQPKISISPEFITPDGNGKDDWLSIRYTLDEEGYMIQLYIFNLEGKRIRCLAEGSLPGTGGTCFFDGKGEDGRCLPGGYYIVYFHAYHQNGKIFTGKKSFLLAI